MKILIQSNPGPGVWQKPNHLPHSYESGIGECEFSSSGKNKIKCVRTHDYHFWLENRCVDTSRFYNMFPKCIIYHELEF